MELYFWALSFRGSLAPSHWVVLTRCQSNKEKNKIHNKIHFKIHSERHLKFTRKYNLKFTRKYILGAVFPLLPSAKSLSCADMLSIKFKIPKEIEWWRFHAYTVVSIPERIVSISIISSNAFLLLFYSKIVSQEIYLPYMH